MDDEQLQTNSSGGATPRWDQVQMPDSAGQLPAVPEPTTPELGAEPTIDEASAVVDPQRSIFRTRLSSAARFGRRESPEVVAPPAAEAVATVVADVQQVTTEPVAVAQEVAEPSEPAPEAKAPVVIEPEATAVTPEVASTTIAINISLPELTKLGTVVHQAAKITLKLIRAALRAIQSAAGQILSLVRSHRLLGFKMPWKVVTVGIAGCLVAVGLVAGGLRLWHRTAVGAGSATGAAARASVGGAVSGAIKTPAAAGPSFSPLVPEGKSQLATVHTGSSSFDPKHNVYSYSDTLRNNAIVVSEQPMPANFTSKEQALTAVAKSINATQSITVGDSKAMVATNTKSNSQTVVYVSGGLLIFVQSPFTHTTPDWQAYLSSLRTQ